MASTAAAQELNSSYQVSGDDWDGTTTETNSSLEGVNAQEAGDNFENDSTTVDVRVTSKVAVDIKPETLNYPFVDVGEQETISNRSFEAVTIRNTGSEYIDRIWLNSSYPTSDPLGGAATDYDAGNFFQVKITSASDSIGTQVPSETGNYHFVNRVEYNFESDSEVPSFITAPNGTTDMEIGGSAESSDGTAPAEVEVGAFRQGGEEYYYALLESSSGCDGTGTTQAELRVADTPTSASQLGTVDFTDSGPENSPADWTSYSVSDLSSSSYGFVGNGGNGVTLGPRTYDVLTACDNANIATDSTERTLRTSFNAAPGDTNDIVANGNGVTNFVYSGDGSNGLAPNSFMTLDTGVEVPRGVTQGSVSPGTFRVFVTSENSVT